MSNSQQSGDRLQPLAYSVKEACKATSLGKTYLYFLIKEGKLEARKIGNRTIIPAASLHALIEGGAA
ncbi:helix-turn-helix domain-containing protein [Erythrobacter tepidarius]|uniref:helix-turn-helix domain-containing protein n=1 Tax=Erythrobacter tepidarius TaxID=60454 RepID=UPI000A3685AE|nr:helix-turn-helix domain-containing protein [Erythrobacter tepidarius]